jgi:hypothetical protein
LTGDPAVLPQNGAGPSGAAKFEIRNVKFEFFASFFPFRIQPSAFPLPALANEGIRASWFLRATLLLPGLAMPEIQFTLRLLEEK